MKFVPLNAFLICLAAFGVAVGQSNDGRGKNNPFSPSPKPNVRIEEKIEPPVNAISGGTTEKDAWPTVAQRTFAIARRAGTRSASPVEIYKVDVGDILFINLLNAPKASDYFTVRIDGTIDFPLAGENLNVAGQTTEDIEANLAYAIKLYSDPRVEVKVREYASHKINVSGWVERPGEKSIQREAIPLYIVRAEAIVDSAAARVVIRRAQTSRVEAYDLRETSTENVLIFPGDSIEFSGGGRNPGITTGEFYYIGGEINSSGQKAFTPGMTLSQAILASGGSKGNQKRATIRRRSEKGVLVVAEHNLRSIRDGKALDPALSPGDMIEVAK